MRFPTLVSTQSNQGSSDMLRLMKAPMPILMAVVMLAGCGKNGTAPSALPSASAAPPSVLRSADRTTPDYSTIKASKYTRYILIKGQSPARSVKETLTEYAQLAGDPEDESEHGTYTFWQATLRDWTLVRLPPEMETAYYVYHNIVYWFLGGGPSDPDAIAQPIGLSVGHGDTASYVVYNDYGLKSVLASRYPFNAGYLDNALGDSLFGTFDTNDKFVLNMPFETYTTGALEQLPGLEELFRDKGVTVEEVTAPELKWTPFDVLFYEKPQNPSPFVPPAGTEKYKAPTDIEIPEAFYQPVENADWLRIGNA